MSGQLEVLQPGIGTTVTLRLPALPQEIQT